VPDLRGLNGVLRYGPDEGRKMMAAFMKGDRVAIIDPVSPFRMRPGRISDIQFTSNNDLFYKVDITHTENSVWVDERNIIRLMEPEQELWKFFIYQDRPIVAYTVAEEFSGEEWDTVLSIANGKGIPITDISIRLGTMNEIVWEKGDANEEV
jgi:hypothetical protein